MKRALVKKILRETAAFEEEQWEADLAAEVCRSIVLVAAIFLSCSLCTEIHRSRLIVSIFYRDWLQERRGWRLPSFYVAGMMS
jgi:hypothetical protein